MSVVVKIMVPFWVPEIMGAVLIIGTQKGTIILTTTHVVDSGRRVRSCRHEDTVPLNPRALEPKIPARGLR